MGGTQTKPGSRVARYMTQAERIAAWEKFMDHITEVLDRLNDRVEQIDQEQQKRLSDGMGRLAVAVEKIERRVGLIERLFRRPFLGVRRRLAWKMLQELH